MRATIGAVFAISFLFLGAPAEGQGMRVTNQFRCQITWEDTERQETHRYRITFTDYGVERLSYRDAANENWVPAGDVETSDGEIEFTRESRRFIIKQSDGQYWGFGRPENGSGWCEPVEMLRGFH